MPMPKEQSIYNEAQQNAFRKRLAMRLSADGMTVEAVHANPEYANWIKNYVQTEVIDKQSADALQGISKRLSNMVVNTPFGTAEYLVVAEYKKHDLTRALYFKKDTESSLAVSEVPMLASTLIV